MAEIARLRELGFDFHDATDEQIAVVESLTEEEIALLLSVKRRLDEAGPDVEGHQVEGGALCW